MKLHRYDNPGDYVAVQTAGNQKAGVSKVWVNEQNIDRAVRILAELAIVPQFGICHGSRYGNEQRWFRDRLPGCEVIGTDISPEIAAAVPYTVAWDFNELNPAWRGRTDFIYSNAFDHAYNPAKAMVAWCATLQPHGVIILEHTSGHEGEPTALDPFRATAKELEQAIPLWTAGEYHVIRTVDTPFRYKTHRYSQFLIIRANPAVGQVSEVL